MRPETILFIFLSLFFLELVWEQFLLWLNLRRAGSSKKDPSDLAREIWGARDYQRAIDYSRSKTYLAVVSSLTSSVFVLVLVLSGWLAGRISVQKFYEPWLDGVPTDWDFLRVVP